jgi:phosphate transport system substrate-binding protein
VVTQEVPVPATAGPAAGSVAVTGAGATFPVPIYNRWFYDYAFVDNSAQFNYQAIGSGGGIKAITEKTVDFAGSDAILNADQKAAAPDVLMFPTVAGAVTVSYNLKDGDTAISGLKLDGATTANIFLGTITKWNDPAITALNPDLKLPDADIVVAHRSDGSGTRFLFTNYLSAVSEDWKNGPGAGTSVEWPTGIGGRGNAGVAGILRDQPNSIGYVDLADAIGNALTFADIQNASGDFITPNVDSITAAQESFAGSMPEDMGQLILNSEDKAAYPISGYTFLLFHQDMADCAKAAAVIKWYRWALTEGDESATKLNYAPLGADVEKLVTDRLATLTCEGKAIEGNQ